MRFIYIFILLLFSSFSLYSQSSIKQDILGQWKLNKVMYTNYFEFGEQSGTYDLQENNIIILINDDSISIARVKDTTKFYYHRSFITLESPLAYKLDTSTSESLFLLFENTKVSRFKKWKEAEKYTIVALKKNELTIKKEVWNNTNLFGMHRTTTFFYFRRVLVDSEIATEFEFEGDWYVCGETPDDLFDKDTIVLSRYCCDFKSSLYTIEAQILDCKRVFNPINPIEETGKGFVFSPLSNEILCFRLPVEGEWYCFGTNHGIYNNNDENPYGDTWKLSEETQTVIIEREDAVFYFLYRFDGDELILVKNSKN